VLTEYDMGPPHYAPDTRNARSLQQLFLDFPIAITKEGIKCRKASVFPRDVTTPEASCGTADHKGLPRCPTVTPAAVNPRKL